MQQHLKTTLARMRGKRQRVEKLHITLVFLGSVDAESADCVQAAADNIRAEPFALELNRLGFFPRPGVVWLAPATIPPELNKLYNDLSEQLQQQCGIDSERRAFHPHVTLIRRSRRRPPVDSIGPIHWPVSDFVLIESRTLPEGARYEVVKKWSLQRPE